MLTSNLLMPRKLVKRNFFIYLSIYIIYKHILNPNGRYKDFVGYNRSVALSKCLGIYATHIYTIRVDKYHFESTFILILSCFIQYIWNKSKLNAEAILIIIIVFLSKTLFIKSRNLSYVTYTRLTKISLFNNIGSYLHRIIFG